MSAAEVAVAATLPLDVVARIDDVLPAHADRHPRKLARLVGLAMEKLHVEGLSDVYHAQRIRSLVSRGLLVVTGNLASMRYSEVRLP